MTSFETIHRGRLPGARIGASIKAAVCEAVGIEPDAPGVRLRGWRFVGESAGYEQWPDVEFDLVVRVPRWAR